MNVKGVWNGPRKLLIGVRFGRLLVLSLHERASRGGYLWLCRCDCGNTTPAHVSPLINGHTQSCGCLQKQRASEANFIHGRSNTPAQGQWSGMKARCYNPKHRAFPDYGGREITVCKRWRDSFLDFIADMGECPPGMTLERIDNDKGYCKENCRWATYIEQGSNRRNNRILEFEGERMCVSAWARRLGCKPALIITRLNNNWTTERALTTPLRAQRRARATSTLAT